MHTNKSCTPGSPRRARIVKAMKMLWDKMIVKIKDTLETGVMTISSYHVKAL